MSTDNGKSTTAASKKKALDELKRMVEEAELRANLFQHRADIAEGQLRLAQAREALSKLKK